LNEFVEVALLGKTVGLKGFVKLHNKGDFPNQFKKNAMFYDKDGKELVVKSYNRTNDTISFYGFENIDSAKTLTNKIIYSTEEETRKNCKLKKDEFFQFDIIGLKVVENGEILGIVEDIQDNFANSLLHIKTDEELIACGKPKNFYIPYLERFIESVNLESGEILVKGARDILENS